MHNRLQLLIGLSTALLPTFGAVALAASKGDVGRPWLILFPLTGLLLSAIGFITGATDRKLVTIYRDQLSWTAECLLSAYAVRPSVQQFWLHFGRNPAVVDQNLAVLRLKGSIQASSQSRWDRMISWRWEPLSVTRLPAVLSLAFIVIWLVLLVILLLNI
jgi:hypothetical protein